jgi:cbb3-type cytochrome oxidase subunit 3
VKNVILKYIVPISAGIFLGIADEWWQKLIALFLVFVGAIVFAVTEKKRLESEDDT